MECEECNLCCKLLPIDGVGSPSGKWCKHCEIGKGCKIYNKRPKECISFRCAYNHSEKCVKRFRPDKCGVVFEKISDNVFIGIKEEKKKLKKAALDQVKSFNKQGFSVVINALNENPIIYKIEKHSKEEIMEDLKKKNDSTKLH